MATISGSSGNDVLVATATAETIDGKGGFDYVDYRNSTGSVTVNLLSGSGSGGYAAGDDYISIERILGSNYDDNLYGDNTPNIINAWLGDDFVQAYGGNDTLYGDTTGIQGEDTMYGGIGRDRLYGGGDKDTLYGGDGTDSWAKLAHNQQRAIMQ